MAGNSTWPSPIACDSSWHSTQIAAFSGQLSVGVDSQGTTFNLNSPESYESVSLRVGSMTSQAAAMEIFVDDVLIDRQ